MRIIGHDSVGSGTTTGKNVTCSWNATTTIWSGTLSTIHGFSAHQAETAPWHNWIQTSSSFIHEARASSTSSSFIDQVRASPMMFKLHRSYSSFTHDAQASSMKLDLHPSYSSFIHHSPASSMKLELLQYYSSFIDRTSASSMKFELHWWSSSFIHYHPASSIVLESARGWRTLGDTLLRLSSLEGHYPWLTSASVICTMVVHWMHMACVSYNKAISTCLRYYGLKTEAHNEAGGSLVKLDNDGWSWEIMGEARALSMRLDDYWRSWEIMGKAGGC